jgi:hypothetical protein
MTLGRYEVLEPGGIDTREELIAALAIAASLEHSLLVQYLFAAFSLRNRPGPGVDERQVELVRDWERTLLAVAREEMVHFATVTKIAVAVGGAPHLDRPRLPQPAGGAFPFAMHLHRFDESELERFVRFETPAVAVAAEAFGLAPDPLAFEYLGEMYGQIIAGIKHLAAEHGDSWLLVGPPELRDAEDWGLNHAVAAIPDSASAVAAIQQVIDEGEGGPNDAENSHWQRFLRVQAALTAELEANPGFEPTHPIAESPVTRAGAGEAGVILEGVAREVAELFNHLYVTVLMLLGQFYAPAGETPAQRDELQATVRRSMSAILRPVAEALSALPARGNGPERAGAPFETYGAIALASSPAARWAVLDERLERAADEAVRLAALPELPRLRFISENIVLMRDAIARVAAGEEVGVARPRV